MEDTCVRVALRIRPMIPREIIDMCHECTSVAAGEPQVWLGSDKAFTFDHVFDTKTEQARIYDTCIQNLIEGCFEGYNATVLAYGQTGSGKTYTMGTGFDVSSSLDDVGIIPRAVEHLFSGIARLQNQAQDNGQSPPEFKVVAQFMELYNEEIIDLLDSVGEGDYKGKRSHVKIHEDPQGGIYTVGLTTRVVSSADETLQCLKIGALSRTTASTQMNVQSSRSHAIFTLHIKQQRVVELENIGDMENGKATVEELETLTSKFHFVDLAGSERLKRTGATGDRAKEGISINCGLLALGNVISALGDKSRKASHIPYRDSKVTRLLQDSLGGNSQTLMIACISPSDRDFMETLNTLKYANRAKNIKNKVSVNHDKSSQLISSLRREIQQLKLELVEYRQGKRVLGDDGTVQVNDMFHENNMLSADNNNLRTRLKALSETLEHQTRRVTDLLAERDAKEWIMQGGDDTSQSEVTDLIKGYLKEIEDLRTKLLQAEEMCAQYRKQAQKMQSRLSYGSPLRVHNASFPEIDLNTTSQMNLLTEAKQEIEKQKKLAKTLQCGSAVEKGSKEELKQELDDEKDDAEFQVNGDGAEGSDEEVEDSESSDDSDHEEKDVADDYGNDLAELQIDISMKQRLIEALEQNQQRLQTMRKHYEDKVLQLELKIRETQMERDRVLASINLNKENRSEKDVKKIKADFEKELSALQTQLKKMQAAKKANAQLMKNQSQNERQINQLRNELLGLKRSKVDLIKKMKEESQRHQHAEQRINKEIAQLKKQSRARENQIRLLEAEKKGRENVLRRKQEEIIALRRAKPMSESVQGRVPQHQALFAIKRTLPFSPKVAKTRWQRLEKSINQLVISKQTVYNIERDMERFLLERERLTRQFELLEKKRARAVRDGKSEAVLLDIDDQIEGLRANIDYYHDNIVECQTSIMQLEETKDDMDILDVKNLVHQLSTGESKYLVEKLLNMAINQAFEAAQKDLQLKESEARLEQTISSNEFQVQLLEHIVQDTNPEILQFINDTADPVSESRCSTRSSSPIDSSLSETFLISSALESPKLIPGRKTGVPHELRNYQRTISPQPIPIAYSAPDAAHEKPQHSRLAWSFGPALLKEELEGATASNTNSSNGRGIVRVTSAPTSLKEMGDKPKLEPSPLAKRKYYDRQMPDVSPAFRRKFYLNTSNIPAWSRQSSVETTASDVTPPMSPTALRKTREDNVFSRLTSGSFRSNKPLRGTIAPSVSKASHVKNSPFICTHEAVGHSRAVLSIAATDEVLFSGSKDRTVKIWDLTSGREIQSLGGHPSNVSSVQYCEYSRLAFSVSSAFIKVWDVRDNPAKCVKTLSSSGSNNTTLPTMNTPSRTFIMPHGETQIHDIALNNYGTTLFSAAANIVRMWDLRMFQVSGKLSGGHQAAIMCLAVQKKQPDKNIIVTGSKDHYIKVFEVAESACGLHTPKMNLEPPHYDGIQSLAIFDDYLFSGSRDTCIKKWNLKTRSHIQSLNQAHKDWVYALCCLPKQNSIVSGCRGGFLKLWTCDAMKQLGEIRAHNAPVNAVVANSSAIFSASNDCTVTIWRLRNSNDVSPDYNEMN